MPAPPKKLLLRLLPVAGGIAMILIWYAARFTMPEERRFMVPAPDAVVQALLDHREQFWAAANNSGNGALLGFTCAVTLSLLFALTLASSQLIRASFYPYLMMLQMTPIIVLAPILILWAGPGWKSVTIITFLICFFPMVVNTTQGLISTERNLVDLFRMYKATRRQEMFLLRLPSAMPYFFTGMRIAATLAPIGAIVGDTYAGTSAGGQAGLGFLAIVFSSRLQVPALFATAGVSCALGFLFVSTVVSLSWWSLHKWHDSFNRKDT